MNKILLIGRMVKDPELRFSQGGTAVATFTVAVNRRFPNKNTGEKEADFINCVSFGNGADFVSKYFKKGQQVGIEGRLQVQTYDKDGERRWVTQVIAEQFDFCGSSSGGSGAAKSKKKEPDYASNDNGLGEEIIFNDEDLPF